MNLPLATVSKVLKFSCVDGPGNRLVLFLQGCNFACPTCHNPHTMKLCNDCGDCVSECPTGALTIVQGKVVHDASICDQCDKCLDVCPINANPKVTQYSVDDVLALLYQNKPFLNGITISGGEATTQLKFIISLFTAIKTDEKLKDLTCFIDSNGYLPEAAWKTVLPVTDGVMLDIKAFNNTLHRLLTTRSNERVLATAKLLFDSGKLHELRYLLIPGRTDSDEEIEDLANFVRALDTDTPLRLNAFQHHGVKGEALTWPTMKEPDVERIAAELRSAGLTNVVVPAVYI
ncbi:Benzylsuccinate synthase activating enzyme [Pseudovibrio sp. Ad46]|uniref:YjjW family glycine radical enzyme activase n=1 Tax=Pseudovibrio sp. Ad46 TaxID=989432 RepID=UPI0007AE9B76|nr:YjjW family glycine radical enzyme activase [Pseudovibrio sp. Ad46]KZK88611.1 Benzylsuccinate synthase activating enzyme [Pseudovibrio sp. Ad46]